MKQSILSATALAALTLAVAGASAEEVTAWRLFVSDHAEPVVHVVDAVAGEPLQSFAIGSPASLYRSESGEAVYAVQREAGLVTAIATGIAFDDHGDHADIAVEAPQLTGATVEGETPVHFVEHDGAWAAFFDGEGVARVFAESDALAGNVSVREVDAGVPHHGVVVAYGEHDLVSEPHPQDPSNLPIGIKVLDRSGAQVGDLATCPDLHGEASSGNLLAFACATGLLVVTPAPGAPSIEHLPYAETLPEGKTTTLIGGRGLQYFLGNYGPSAVVLIEPGDDASFRLIELPARRVHFAVDPIRGGLAYAFTEDGQLHQIDVIAGTLAQSVALTGPYSMDGHWSDPRPRVAVAGDSIVVTDPVQGRLHLVDAESFTKAGEIALDGMPFNIVAVGGTATVHDGDGDHD